MSQPFGLSSKGGLYTSLNQLEMLQQPGIASKLVNFEVDINGGYRRINGFTPFGGASATRPNGDTKVLGIKGYADGVVVCSGDDIFFSIDGIEWLQVNKISAAGGDNYTTFTGKAVSTRANQGQCEFGLFQANYDYGELLIADGANEIFSFRMEGSGALNTRTFFTKEISVLPGAHVVTHITIHDHHLIAAGVGENESTVYYSVNLEPDNFTGVGSGAITISDQVVGLKPFRNELYIFGQNSINKLININDSNTVAIVPVAKNVGCLDSQSIQEMAGDLLFLSADGLRTVAGTARIGDVELGTVSRPVQSIIQNISENIDALTLASVVVRNKSQYRLFYNSEGTANASAKGIIATLTKDGFEYSEIQGIKATAISADFGADGIERTWHGDTNGYIYNHDVGNAFNYGGVPNNIVASYQTPNLDFGDVGTKKTIKYVRVSISPEGEIQPTLRIRYDYEDPTVAQPLDYVLDGIPLPSIFGSGIFGTNVFGATPDPLIRQAVEGSGDTVSFIITSADTYAPYTINGLYVDYTPSGRR